MGTYKTANGETVEFEGEKYYTVGQPDLCNDGCCVPVFVVDMQKDEGPLFFVATEHKSQLAAALLGVSTEEVEMFMNVIQEGSSKDDEEKWLKLREALEEA